MHRFGMLGPFAVPQLHHVGRRPGKALNHTADQISQVRGPAS